MYKKILGAALRFPNHMTEDARDICDGMLKRDPTERLGSNGAGEIKAHPFFKILNFDAVLRKEVEPSFKPVVSGEADTRNVDKTFTDIPAAVTPTPAGNQLSAAVQEKEFSDFTFVPGGALDAGGL